MFRFISGRTTRDLSRRAVVLFFVLLTLVGLISGLSYSLSTDEDAEYGILKSNMAEYMIRIFGENSPLSHIFGSATPISESIERDHGLSAYYPAAPALLLLNRISRHAMMLGWHTWTFLLFMLGVISLYAIARELFHASRRFGCAAALLLYLTPRMFAEGHYNNKDIVLLSLVLLVIWLGIRFVRQNRLRDAILFSIAGAFAANTKIIGAWVWGIFGLLFLLMQIVHKTHSSKMWRNGLIAIGVFIAGYATLTPAMWSGPVEFIRYLFSNATQFSRWKLFVLFEGDLISTYTGEVPPWYYLPKLICMTTPIPILLLSIGGFVSMIWQLMRSKSFPTEKSDIPWILLATIIACAVPLLMGMFSGMVVYNGWRHFYFTYAAMLLLTVHALKQIFDAVRNRKILFRTCSVALAAYFACHSVLLIINHPLQGSYYNPIAAKFVEDNYETDYWLLSTGPAVEGILEHATRNPSFEPNYTTCAMAGVIVSRADQARPDSAAEFTYNIDEANYYIAFDMYESLIAKIPDDVYADFAREFYERYELIEADSPSRNWNEDDAFSEVFSLYAYDMKIATVYERNR